MNKSMFRMMVTFIRTIASNNYEEEFWTVTTVF